MTTLRTDTSGVDAKALEHGVGNTDAHRARDATARSPVVAIARNGDLATDTYVFIRTPPRHAGHDDVHFTSPGDSVAVIETES